MENKTKNLLLGGTLITAGAVGTLMAMNAMKTIPKGVVPVKPFDINKFMGKWYEIARLDYRFERNMNNTTAEYSMNNDGSVKVVNSGYNYDKGKFEDVTGKAVFAASPDEGALKVSFFGPFYTGYNVIAIDPNYKYALVAGKNRHYLWLLSRAKTMPEEIKHSYLQIASGLGFDVSKLIWVEHTINPENKEFCTIIDVEYDNMMF